MYVCIARHNLNYAHDHLSKSDAFVVHRWHHSSQRLCRPLFDIIFRHRSRSKSAFLGIEHNLSSSTICMFLLCTTCLCALSFLFLCFFVDAFLSYMVFLDIVFRFPFEAWTLCFALHSALTLLITVLCFRSCHSSLNSFTCWLFLYVYFWVYRYNTCSPRVLINRVVTLDCKRGSM